MSNADLSELATPILIRLARGAYGRAIRAELHAVGIDDLPRNGPLILARISWAEGDHPDLPVELGITKQAVSQVIETLVTRGYVERRPVPEDRRRVGLTLTWHGQEALDAVILAVDAVDAQLSEQVSHQSVHAMREALMALARINVDNLASGAGMRKPPRLFRNFSPIFPVSDLAAALAHYSTLGFETHAEDGGDQYGFANREGMGVHLATDADLDPATNSTATYLYVLDADALYEEWSRPGIAGTTRPVRDTPYRMREGAHIDPDGNLIRFGSLVE